MNTTDDSVFKQFAAAILPMIMDYYSDPENMAAYEAWKAERDKAQEIL